MFIFNMYIIILVVLIPITLFIIVISIAIFILLINFHTSTFKINLFQKIMSPFSVNIITHFVYIVKKDMFFF